MRRDMDLWRRILIDVEERGAATGYYGFPNFPDVDQAILIEHCILLTQANMVESDIASGMYAPLVQIWRLTNAGHDFLANLRSDTIWKETQEKAKRVGGSLSIDVLKALAVALVKSHLGI